VCKEQGNVFQAPEGKLRSLKGDCNRRPCVQRNEIKPFIKSMWVKRELLIGSICQHNDIATWPVLLSPCGGGAVHSFEERISSVPRGSFCSIVIWYEQRDVLLCFQPNYCVVVQQPREFMHTSQS